MFDTSGPENADSVLENAYPQGDFSKEAEKTMFDMDQAEQPSIFRLPTVPENEETGKVGYTMVTPKKKDSTAIPLTH